MLADLVVCGVRTRVRGLMACVFAWTFANAGTRERIVVHRPLCISPFPFRPFSSLVPSLLSHVFWRSWKFPVSLSASYVSIAMNGEGFLVFATD